MKRFYLVRHGQTNANAQEYVPGKDEPLNETGQLQAAQLAGRVSNLDVQKLIASDFIRAQQTITPIAQQKKMQPEIVSAFGEMLEPTSLVGVSDSDEQVIAYRLDRNANVENKDWAFEDGEGYYSLQMRINQAREFLEKVESENTLVVAHAYFLQCFVASMLLNTTLPTKEFLQVAMTLRMSNTGISLVTLENGRWRVVMYNDHAHFAE